MSAHTFNTRDNRQFWQSHQGSYQGATNSSALIFLVRPYVGKHILDAGAGDGSLVRQLQSEVAHALVRGIDLAPKSADVEQGDITNLSYASSSFDTAFCAEVIEHLSPEDTARVLRELWRVLMPGGVLVLTTPYAENLEEDTVHCPKCNVRFHRWGHQQSFVDDDFRQLALQHGFEPLSIFPVKYGRVRRFRVIGRRLFMSRYFTRGIRKAAGKRHLIMIARKPLAVSP